MTAAQRLEFLVEEPSMEAFLRGLLLRLLTEGCAFDIRTGTPRRSGTAPTSASPPPQPPKRA